MELLAGAAQEALQRIIGRRCEKCGFGYRHEDESGQRKWCRRCIESYYRKEKLTEDKAEKMIFDIVEPLYYDAIFDSLNPDIQDKLSELKPGQDLFLFGPAGVGKTHTLAALIRQYIYDGYQCERIHFNNFCVKVRSTFAPAAKETAYELIEKLKIIDKLVIDDLGLRSDQESQFVYDIFFDILNKRQERVLPCLISSNKSILQLEQTFDARVASRLQTALVIEMTGDDRRVSERI